MSAKFTVVHTDPPAGNTLANERAELARADADLVTAEPGDGDKLRALAASADGLINTVLPLDRDLISGLGRCRVIVRTGVGVDNVDVAAATERGIVVACVPDASVEEVSNHALMFLLACSRKLVPLDRALHQGVWDRRMLAPMGAIHGQALGLVGFGRIARALGRKAAALGMRVLAYDPYLPDEDVRSAGADPRPLDDLLRQADFVSLHVPLSPETRHLVNGDSLALMKPSAFLINTARGGLIDEEALASALEGGRLAGAALDVFEREPLQPDNRLLRLNVLTTPHSAAFSDSSVAEIRRRAGEAAADVLLGFWPRGLANSGVAPAWPLASRPQ